MCINLAILRKIRYTVLAEGVSQVIAGYDAKGLSFGRRLPENIPEAD